MNMLIMRRFIFYIGLESHVLWAWILYSNLILLFIFLSDGESLAQEWFKVRWVNDGDTIVLMDDRQVRYIGINAPEIGHADKKAEPYGYTAKNFKFTLLIALLVVKSMARSSLVRLLISMGSSIL